jgi:DNA-directed RNA polymerase subunit RPC12/RpoP
MIDYLKNISHGDYSTRRDHGSGPINHGPSSPGKAPSDGPAPAIHDPAGPGLSGFQKVMESIKDTATDAQSAQTHGKTASFRCSRCGKKILKDYEAYHDADHNTLCRDCFESRNL